MNDAIIWTDGSSVATFGGWAALIYQGGEWTELTGSLADTTNNAMELMGVIASLASFEEPTHCYVVSDSAYVVNTMINEWDKLWEGEHGRGSNRPNIRLWRQLRALVDKHDVEFVKVKGHADDHYNNKVDILAGEAARKLRASADPPA